MNAHILQESAVLTPKDLPLFINIRKKFTSYWRSYSPLLVFFNTVKPAFFASLIESGLRMEGVLKLEMIF